VVQDGLCRDDQQDLTRGRWERLQLTAKAFFEPDRQCHVIRRPEPARQFLGRQPLRQIQEQERVASRLGHDPVTNLLVERAPDHRFQQRAGVSVEQTVDHKFGKPLQDLLQEVLQQYGLAHPRLAAQDQYSAPTSPQARHDLVQGLALEVPPP